MVMTMCKTKSEFSAVIRCMMPSCEMWSVLRANEWQERMCVKTDVSSEVPPDLQLSKLTCFDNRLGTPMLETGQERGTV